MEDVNEFPLVWISWSDSSVLNGWGARENATDHTLGVESVGWLLEESDASVTIVGHRTERGGVCAPMTIPKVAIIDRWDISL